MTMTQAAHNMSFPNESMQEAGRRLAEGGETFTNVWNRGAATDALLPITSLASDSVLATSFNLTWDAVVGAADMIVIIHLAGGEATTQILAGSATGVVLTELVPDGKYRCLVGASGVGGNVYDTIEVTTAP